jgi:DivIVA domain-containing protein
VEGYDMQGVDDFLDRVQDDLQLRLAAGTRTGGADEPVRLRVALVAGDVTAASFPRTRVREGYHIGEVNSFVEEVAARFDQPDAALARRGVRVRRA